MDADADEGPVKTTYSFWGTPDEAKAVQAVADLYLEDHIAPPSMGMTDDGIQRSLIAGTCAMATGDPGMSFVPGIIFYLIGLKYFVEGIVMTGLKN